MKCLLIILYSTEACLLAKKDISSMEYILNCIFSKIFNEYRKAFSFDHINPVVKNRQMKFMQNFLFQIRVFVKRLVLFRVIILLVLLVIIFSYNCHTVLGLIFIIIVCLSDLYVFYICFHILPFMA